MCTPRFAMKMRLLLVFWAAVSLTDNGVASQAVNCFSVEACAGPVLDGTFTFDSCCLDLGSQSYMSSSGQCTECSIPRVEFCQRSYAPSEGDRLVSLELVRYSDSSSELVVSVTIKDGTARGGFDYGVFPEEELTFSTVFLVNETSMQFGIPINDDNIVEHAENFTASLSMPDSEALQQLGYDTNPNPENLQIGHYSTAVVSIVDNDFVNITITPGSVERSESEADQPVQFVVLKEGLAERAVEVVALTQNLSDYAVDGRDYIGFTETVLRFEPDETRMDLVVSVLEDSVVESTEQFSIVLLPGDDESGVRFPEGQSSTINILDNDDVVQLSFEQLLYTVSEEEGAVPITIFQIGESERPIMFTVVYNRSTTTATNGSDFIFVESTMTTQLLLTSRPLADGETLLVGEIEIFKDGLYEPDEDIVLQIYPAEGEMSLITGDPATIVIQDSDEVMIGFADSEVTVSEPTSFNISVILLDNNLEPGTAVQLDIRAMDGVATGDEDYVFTFNEAQFSFLPDGEPSLEVSVEIIDDEVFEGRENFRFTLSSPQPRVVFTNNQLIEITDNEDLLIDFDMDVYEVNETDEYVLVEVELTSQIERDIELLLVTRDGRASGGLDYEAFSEVLTFRPDSKIVTAQVDLINDELNEGLEDFTLQLVLTDEQLGTPDVLRESTVRIFDDEVTFVEFSSEVYHVSEGENFVVLVINKTGVTQEDVPVIVNLEDGSAKAGDVGDYGPFNSPSLSVMARLLADEVAIPFGVVIREDRRVEHEEFFTARLTLPPSEGSNVKLGRVEMATVYIEDNDRINVTVFPESEQVEESDSRLLLSVSRNNDLTLDRNVIVSVSTIMGTATEDDFKAEEVLLNFTENGAKTFTYAVDIFQDAIAEGAERLTVHLAAPAGEKGVVFHRNSSEIIILDNDISMIQFTQTLFEADEINGEVEICLTKDLETSSRFTVILSPQETVPSPPDTFQARADIDFDSTPVPVTFDPEDQTACGTIILYDDAQLGETREVFAVLLSLPEDTPNIEFGSVRTATVEVTDTPDVLFGFERTELAVDEAEGDVQICVVVFNPGPSDALEANITFDIAPSLGTADSDDYQLISEGTEMLGNSSRRVCFTVQIKNDVLFEDEVETISFEISEDFKVQTTMEQDGRMLRVLSRPATITVSITDDDRDIVIGFEESEVAVVEGNVSQRLCINVTRPTLGEDLNAVINIIIATISGSAGPSDYVPISAVDRDTVLEFNNATRRNCFMISILPDSLFEGPEVFTVQLTAQVVTFIGTSQSVSLSPSVATVTIIDNNTQLIVGFEEGSLSQRVREDVGVVSLCVVVTGREEITTSFAVSVDFLSGTADPQFDFFLEPDLTLTFDELSRRQCFDVQVVSDGEDEEEFFDLVLSLIQFFPGLTLNPARSTARVNILPISTPEPPTPTPIVANDTVIGDPLFTVPLNVANGLELLPRRAKILDGFPNLCYEIHGEENQHFNLVSDTCATVNAHYTASNSPDLLGWNVISTIGVRASNHLERCVNIEVGLDNGCVPIITEDGFTSQTTPRYQSAGITVSKHRNQVRVSVPNCQNIQLVMWITCQDASGFPMIRYDITRGINLRPTSHGLIGQFWNVPINISRYTYTGSQTIDYLDLESLYAVTVSPPLIARPRTFIAELYTFTWEPRNEVCFYAGNIQGGRLAEITDDKFNAPVIEGSYKDYIVNGLFEHDFAYSQFSADMC